MCSALLQINAQSCTKLGLVPQSLLWLRIIPAYQCETPVQHTGFVTYTTLQQEEIARGPEFKSIQKKCSHWSLYFQEATISPVWFALSVQPNTTFVLIWVAADWGRQFNAIQLHILCSESYLIYFHKSAMTVVWKLHGAWTDSIHSFKNVICARVKW